MREQIIYFLKQNKDYLSGEEISRSLNISRAGIWKHIQELRNFGYKIEAIPRKGYRLLSCPDKLFPWEVQFKLNTRIFGKKVIYHQEVASTMDEAFELGLKGAPEGTIVCAETQTKGRGRMGRNWVSPAGKGLYFSLLLRPRLSCSEAAKLTLLSAVALCEALINIGEIGVQIKWPNDLLVGERKIAGILTELNAELDRVKFVVVGMGINVNAPVSQLPPGATSLKIESARKFSRIAVIKEILMSFEKWYDVLNKDGFEGIMDAWRKFSSTLGKRIRLEDQAGFVEGKAVDIAEDGGLLLLDDAGKILKKMSGDVLPVR